MVQLEKEMAQIVFEDGLDSPAEYVHMSYIMKHLHEMNNVAGNVADQELKRLSRLASIFSNHVRAQQSGITGEDRVEQYLHHEIQSCCSKKSSIVRWCSQYRN